MKKTIYYLLILTLTSLSYGADIKIVAVKGTAMVRHNIQEEWKTVSVGDVLKPEDSIELKRKSSVTILLDGMKKLTIPEFVIIDLSDLRMLTQEELLLKLAMEKVRSVPTRDDDGKLLIPTTTTVHGTNKESTPTPQSIVSDNGLMQLNGTKVLYENRFYATCVLKAKEVFRLNPELAVNVETRLMVANALEKMNLKTEALSEYIELSSEKLSQTQRSFIEHRIEQLKTAEEK
ncbi:MAG: hypothetical protein QME52_14250 [Bacteroidota bacterium]|nr:hypothetical protein [Bacteroidota bacterium]